MTLAAVPGDLLAGIRPPALGPVDRRGLRPAVRSFSWRRRWIDRGARLEALAACSCWAACKALLGWYMVKSGLIDRPDVSQYRLVAHLGAGAGHLRLHLCGWRCGCCWRSARRPSASPRRSRCGPAPCAGAGARHHALRRLRRRPRCRLRLQHLPADGRRTDPARPLRGLSPWWRSLFEDVTTVQFMHRLLATLTLLGDRSLSAGRCVGNAAVAAGAARRQPADRCGCSCSSASASRRCCRFVAMPLAAAASGQRARPVDARAVVRRSTCRRPPATEPSVRGERPAVA